MNVVIIPSLNPNEKLIHIVKELQNKGLKQILIVDDGSSKQEIFQKLDLMNIPVVHHKHNMGKGAAIKTGVSESSNYYHDIQGYVFMDSDCQHDIDDVLKINQMMEEKDEIVLGVRNFHDKNVPLRSRLGNQFSSFFFHLSTGKRLSDTQTGLRAIPVKYTTLLLRTVGERYEYEMNFLNDIAIHSVPYMCIPIQTIYEDKNKESHFHTIRDSVRIYQEPLKYLVTGFTSFIVDMCLFTVFNSLLSFVFLANIFARCISGIYNYSLNKYWCFKKYGKNSGLKYFILFLINMIFSSCFVQLFSIFNIPIVVIKIIVDSGLFIMSYVIQKKHIFRGDDPIENI